MKRLPYFSHDSRIWGVVIAILIVVSVLLAATACYEIGEQSDDESQLAPTRFQPRSSGSSSAFDISYRPMEKAIDYEVTVYQTETSVMPLGSVKWSQRSESQFGVCLPADERDYCIRMPEGLYDPHWFSIAAIYSDRKVEGERFCFHRDAFYGGRNGCPASEAQGWVVVAQGDNWTLEKPDTLENMKCRYRESCQPIQLNAEGTPTTDCTKICEPKADSEALSAR